MNIPGSMVFKTVRERFIFTAQLRSIQDERSRYADLIAPQLAKIKTPARNNLEERINQAAYREINKLIGKIAAKENTIAALEEELYVR